GRFIPPRRGVVPAGLPRLPGRGATPARRDARLPRAARADARRPAGGVRPAAAGAEAGVQLRHAVRGGDPRPPAVLGRRAAGRPFLAARPGLLRPRPARLPPSPGIGARGGRLLSGVAGAAGGRAPLVLG